MVKEYTVEGYESFKEKVKEVESSSTTDKIFILFSGSRNEEGVSWCPDCVKAEPIIGNVLKKYEDRDDIHFLHVGVGERSFWKDPKCVFRTDSKLRLTRVPTLIRWGGSQRLEEEECFDESLIQLIFDDDDE